MQADLWPWRAMCLARCQTTRVVGSFSLLNRSGSADTSLLGPSGVLTGNAEGGQSLAYVARPRRTVHL